MQLATTNVSGTTTMSMTAAISHIILLPSIPARLHNDSWLKPVPREGGTTLMATRDRPTRVAPLRRASGQGWE